MGTPGQAEFTGFQQGNQNGSGAEGSSEDVGGFVTVGLDQRAQSANPVVAGRRGRDNEQDRDFSRRRVPQASPRAAPAASQQGAGMEVMFQQFLTAMTQLLHQSAGGQAQNAQPSQGQAGSGGSGGDGVQGFKRIG